MGQLGEARVKELVQCGKGDIDLELRAGRPQQPDPGAGGDGGGLVQQGGLPHARVTRQQQRFPGSLRNPADELAQLLDLRFAAEQFGWPCGRLIVARAGPVHHPTFPCLPEHVQGGRCPARPALRTIGP